MVKVIHSFGNEDPNKDKFIGIKIFRGVCGSKTKKTRLSNKKEKITCQRCKKIIDKLNQSTITLETGISMD